MASLTPVQLLLWIAGLELISIPLIIFTVNAIFIGFFKAKEQHQGRMLNSLAKTIETIAKTATEKIQEKIDAIEKKEEAHNDSKADS